VTVTCTFGPPAQNAPLPQPPFLTPQTYNKSQRLHFDVFLPTSSRVCKVSIFQLRHSPFFTWFVFVTFQALHKSQYLIFCKLPATLLVFTSESKGTFPGQSEGAGSINIIRNIAIKLGDFDGVARVRRAYFLTQHIQVSVPRHTPCSTTVTVTLVSKQLAEQEAKGN